MIKRKPNHNITNFSFNSDIKRKPNHNVVGTDVDLPLLPPVGAFIHHKPRFRPHKLVWETQRHNLEMYNVYIYVIKEALKGPPVRSLIYTRLASGHTRLKLHHNLEMGVKIQYKLVLFLDLNCLPQSLKTCERKNLTYKVSFDTSLWGSGAMSTFFITQFSLLKTNQWPISILSCKKTLNFTLIT